MFWFFLTVVTFFILFYIFVIRDRADDGIGFGLFKTFSITFGAFVVYMVVFGGTICSSLLEVKYVKVAEQTLSAIRDKDGISGSFFLGSGSLESHPYYVYYVRLDNGGVRPDRISANNSVTIFEEDRQDAKLVWWEWQYARPVRYSAAWWFAIPVGESTKSWAFHVPKGTVRAGYSM